MFKDYPDVITIDELTKMLHIGKNTAYSLVKDKVIKNVRVGKKYLIPKCYVIEYLKSVN